MDKIVRKGIQLSWLLRHDSVSIPVDVELKEATDIIKDRPFLWHGTSDRFIDDIKAQGIQNAECVCYYSSRFSSIPNICLAQDSIKL